MVILNKTNNLPNFDYRGKNSLEDYKIYMTSKPTIPSPEMRLEHIAVKGRDSTYTITDGTYEDIEIHFGVRTYRGTLSYQDTLNKLNEWLRISYDIDDNEILFSEYPQWYFKVKSVSPYTWQYNPATGEMTTELSFRCEPFKYSDRKTIVMGQGTSPTPTPSQYFKVSNKSHYIAKVESNLQDITRLAKFGYDRVLSYPDLDRQDLDRLTEVDGAMLNSSQSKFTSGNLRNYQDDFYSGKINLKPDAESTMTVIDSTKAHVKHIGATAGGTIEFDTEQMPYRGYFQVNLNAVVTKGNIKFQTKVFTDNGSLLASVDGSSVNFWLASGNIAKVQLIFLGDGEFIIDSPTIVQGFEPAKLYTPAHQSSWAGVVVAMDLAAMLSEVEPDIFKGATDGTAMKNILKGRNFIPEINASMSHATSSQGRVFQLDKAANKYQPVVSAPLTKTSKMLTSTQDSNTFIDRLIYKNVEGKKQLWAIYLFASETGFEDPGFSLYPYNFSIDQVFLKIDMSIIPTVSRDVINDGTAVAYPYIKAWGDTAATSMRFDFTSTDVTGRPYQRYLIINNLLNVKEGQHIEIDCEYHDIIRYQENNPDQSIQWNTWSSTSGYPVLNPNTTKITTTNVLKAEIEWRTRKI
ncbi:hypothetical protein PDK35_02400 [Bacillus cereus group sp. TH153LC]|uniref:hypothetical protein n=1 Tax=Bacillus cereus group sp. TH153LC TaxID=3018059 RepID=UPI0022E2E4C3|nr:hypothetical protein [Bacillus cereus group sp. TH153LC]MDA1658826.1 hypothetical protein [Bacillus cereus group sp. TH153LC]